MWLSSRPTITSPRAWGAALTYILDHGELLLRTPGGHNRRGLPPAVEQHMRSNSDFAHGLNDRDERGSRSPALGAAALLPIKLARDDEIGRLRNASYTARHRSSNSCPSRCVRQSIPSTAVARRTQGDESDGGPRVLPALRRQFTEFLRRRGLRHPDGLRQHLESSYNAHRCAIVGLCRENVRMEQESQELARRTERDDGRDLRTKRHHA